MVPGLTDWKDEPGEDLGLESFLDIFDSGDIIELYFHNYPLCTGQMRHVVF